MESSSQTRYSEQEGQQQYDGQLPEVAASSYNSEVALPSTAAKDEGEDEKTLKQPINEGWGWYLRLAAALVLPIFLECLDYTVVATAQPFIASAFNALHLQSYVGTVYILTSTVFLPIFASLADVFGRHSAMQFALCCFLVGSALSTGAQNMAMMLAGRAIAGVGAAGLITLIRTILADTRSLRAQNIQATCLFVLYGLGFSTGPVIGGSLSKLSLRWIFGINLPICAASMVLVFVLLRHRIQKQSAWLVQRAFQKSSISDQTLLQKLSRLDTIGALLFICAGVLLLLGLDRGSIDGWSTPLVIASLTVSGVFFILFAIWENILSGYAEEDYPPSWARADPMIPLAIFKNRDLLIVCWSIFGTGMVFMVAFYFLAIFYTVSSGLDATESGVQLLYFAPGLGCGGLLSIIIIRITAQPKYCLMLGNVILTVALGLLAWAMELDDEVKVKIFLAVMGCGVGLSLGPAGVQARFSLHVRYTAVVAALTLFMQTLGGTIGIAQCAAVLNNHVRITVHRLIETASPENAAILLSGSDLNSLGAIAALPTELQVAVRDAYRFGTRWAFISLIPWTGIAAALVPLLRKIDREVAEPDSVRPDEESIQLQARLGDSEATTAPGPHR